MIRLKQLLFEMTDADIKRCLDKRKNKQFRLIGAGDNGRVYEIDDEDKTFKITKERDEYAVAKKLVNQYSKYTTFIPVYYVNGTDMYIMANASDLPNSNRVIINKFIDDYKNYAREQGGEVSIFDFTKVTDNIDPILDNFLNSLESDVQKTGISDLDLDLDFKTDNIMVWNNKLVMIDW